MWIYTRPRNEYDNRFMLNLDLCSRVNVGQLGERWFVDVVLGTESVPVASAATQEAANAIVRRMFVSLRDGETALDLNALGDGEPAAAPVRQELAGRR